MFRRMLKDAISAGFKAGLILGDAWSGCKVYVGILECHWRTERRSPLRLRLHDCATGLAGDLQ
jgi:hypothetical protein